MSPADLLYPIAIGLGEGGWVTVLYILVDTLSKVHPSLGLPIFAITAGGACLAAARLDRLGVPRTSIVVGLTVGGALVGLLATPSARAALLAGDLVGALGTDPGGALLGVAALRGFIRGGAIRDPDAAARPMWAGIVGLATAWVFAGVLLEPGRSEFRALALVPTLAFVFGSLAAAGLARTEMAAGDGRFDWRVNRAWIVALTGLAAALVIGAVPIGRGTERILAALIAWPPSLPLVIVALVIARLIVPDRRRALRRAGTNTLIPIVMFVVMALIAVVLPQARPQSAEEPGGAAGGLDSGPTTPVFDIVFAAIAVLLVVGTLIFLARAWQGARSADRPDRGRDIRQTVVGGDELDDDGGGEGRRWLGILRRRPAGRPTDAVGAYLAALRELARFPDLQRADRETPAAHARRLRAVGSGTLELELLAADYELARWGARRITATENQRGVERWERLRGSLPARDAGTGGGAAGSEGPRIRTRVHGTSGDDALVTAIPDE